MRHTHASAESFIIALEHRIRGDFRVMGDVRMWQNERKGDSRWKHLNLFQI